MRTRIATLTKYYDCNEIIWLGSERNLDLLQT